MANGKVSHYTILPSGFHLEGGGAGGNSPPLPPPPPQNAYKQ